MLRTLRMLSLMNVDQLLGEEVMVKNGDKR